MPQRDLRDGGPQSFKTSDWLIQLYVGHAGRGPGSGPFIGCLPGGSPAVLFQVPLLIHFYLCRLAAVSLDSTLTAGSSTYVSLDSTWTACQLSLYIRRRDESSFALLSQHGSRPSINSSRDSLARSLPP